MTCYSVNNNTRMGLVISLCSTSNHLISLIPPKLPQMYVCMFLGLLSENIAFADHRHDGLGFLSVVSNVLICRDSPTPTFWILSLKGYDYIVGFVGYISETESWS